MIVGPTAAGKSALALHLARRWGAARILTVDSMQVYRGMDIGTAKPTADERALVPHLLIDLADPAEDFSVVEYARAFDHAMASTVGAGDLPILAGGTGLYLRAVVDGLTPPPRFPEVVAELEAEPDTVALHDRLAALDPLAASRMEPGNRRRVVRALEVTLGSGRPFSSFGPGLATYPEVPHTMVGIDIDRDTLDRRIEERYRTQMELGFLEEVRGLLEGDRPMGRTASQALGYRELTAHLRGELTLEGALVEAVRRTRRFARRQQRWFRRDPRIHWIPFGPVDRMAEMVEGIGTAASGGAGDRIGEMPS